ncbi:hypothetical protein [Ectopseudomonas oleovorans]|nr:hypothetical protein [Pseudomonas oleovorans]MDH1492685.1 hypothetical protein [Pseudomonas oleovorans]WGG21708.1 hypothetical protein N5O83_03130 [Pseudomonas oleovorans]
MAYHSGSASDMDAVRGALVAACTAEGWSWGGEVLSKNGVFVRLQVVSGYLTLLGRTSAGAGDAPNVVRMGTLGSTELTWPLTYELFVFEAEVYMVLNYSVDHYQFCGFGKSTVQGLPGSGNWVMATLSGDHPSGRVTISPISGGFGGTFPVAPAPFWGTSGTFGTVRNYWIHSDLDGQGWWLAQTLAGDPIGIRGAVPLMGLLPNRWNSEAVLLPIRGWKVRPENKITLTLDLEHARWTRVDNYEPGQLISIGPDRWKIFPCYRKNAAARDGGTGIDHSGTLGWAVRYEGP